MTERSVSIAVLCGGKGSRLQPMSDQLPKAMAPIDDRPMLDHILDFFEDKGYHDFSLCIGYKGDVIRTYFEENPRSLDIHFSDQGENASMLQRLHALQDKDFDDLIVIYGDTFINLDVANFLARHQSSGASATLVTAEMRNPLGQIEDDEKGWVSAFKEKPIQKYYIGCFALSHAVFEKMTPEMLAKPDGEGLIALYDQLIQEKTLAAYHHDGVQVSFNTISDFNSAQEVMINFYTEREDNN